MLGRVEGKGAVGKVEGAGVALGVIEGPGVTLGVIEGVEDGVIAGDMTGVVDGERLALSADPILEGGTVEEVARRAEGNGAGGAMEGGWKAGSPARTADAGSVVGAAGGAMVIPDMSDVTGATGEDVGMKGGRGAAVNAGKDAAFMFTAAVVEGEGTSAVASASEIKIQNILHIIPT